jgi:hypothetical protein
MRHRLFWCATRTSGVHVLDRTTLVSLHGDHAPVRTRLDWEKRVLLRGALQHIAQRSGVG